MKRIILMLTAVFTFSTALISCRDTETRTDDVEMETTVDDDVNTNNNLNGTTRGGNMEPDNTGTTRGTTTTNGATDNTGNTNTDGTLDRSNNP